MGTDFKAKETFVVAPLERIGLPKRAIVGAGLVPALEVAKQ